MAITFIDPVGLNITFFEFSQITTFRYDRFRSSSSASAEERQHRAYIFLLEQLLPCHPQKPYCRKPDQLPTITSGQNAAVKIAVYQQCQPLSRNTETRSTNHPVVFMSETFYEVDRAVSASGTSFCVAISDLTTDG